MEPRLNKFLVTHLYAWKVETQSPLIHWKNSNSIYLEEKLLQWSFSYSEGEKESWTHLSLLHLVGIH